MKYPLGIQSFEKLRTGGFAYVDKTALVYQMAKAEQHFFLSRPRRFGKSLLISTLEAYFLGKRELFRGLAMEQLEQDWLQYPVLHLDLNAEKYDSPAALDAVLDWHFRQWELIYGRDENDTTPTQRFKSLIRTANEKTGMKVVILVDEYDKPVLQAIGNPELQDDYRSTLKALFGVAKSMDAYIQFGLFTGGTKFSKVSVFSDLNNLTDISMDERYAELCGITEAEIHANFDSEVQLLADKNGMTKEECYATLKRRYDGYHFEAGSVGMYNPYSLLNTLDRKRFKDYWFETGTPSYIVSVIRQHSYDLDRLTSEEVTADLLGSLDSIDKSPLPIIYQSGYLTIKDYDPRFGSYRLGFPNEEVERGFTKFLMQYYTPKGMGEGQHFIANFVKDVETGKPEQFMQRLESFFAQGDYEVAGDAELYFHNAVSLVFRMMGFYTEVERHTTDGRMDMLVKTADYVYILEFKLDRSADEALQQIEAKQYAAPFAADPRTLYKIGVNFSSQTRRVEGWKIG